MITKTDIDNYMQKVRSSIDSGNFDILGRRTKNLKTLAQLGITTHDLLNDIYNLNSNDSWEEPEPDNNPNFTGEVWQCKKYLHEDIIYIKLKILEEENNKLLIMSYHFDNM